MADSTIGIEVTADTAAAKTALEDIAKATEKVGSTAKKSSDETESDSKSSAGSILQLAGSVMSLKNSLASLSKGSGGVGSILQMAGAGRSATTALTRLGGAGTGAGVAIVGGFALAAAAVVGVTTEVAKNAMGTEVWKKKSVDAVEGVIGAFGRAKAAVSDFWDKTAIGSFMKERADRAAEKAVEAAEAKVAEAERINELTGYNLIQELLIAEAAGDATKSAQLYARVLKEDKATLADMIETQNSQHANSAGQAAATAEGQKLEREDKAFATAREIAKNTKLNSSQSQRVESFEKLLASARNDPIRRSLNLSDREKWGTSGVQFDPANMRQVQRGILTLAAGGVGVEQIATSLADNGMTSDQVVRTLEGLKKSLPDGFADKLLTHIKPGVIAWQ